MSIETLGLFGGIAGILSVALGVWYLFRRQTRFMKVAGVYLVLTGLIAVAAAIISRQ
jgi:multidrug transporter EmrE-like cation transporter